MSVKLRSVCVKLHTVCEITQCAQSYTYSIRKKSSPLKNFTLTQWAAWATNINSGLIRNWTDHYYPHPGRQRRSINSERGWTPRLGWNCQLWKCSLCTGPLSLYFPLSDLFWAISSESQFLHQTRLILCP